MIVYAAQKCECIYESGLDTISLHATKRGAYLACRTWWLDEWNGWNHKVSGDGFHDGYPSKMRRKSHDTATAHKRWTVTAYQVLGVPDNAEVRGA